MPYPVPIAPVTVPREMMLPNGILRHLLDGKARASIILGIFEGTTLQGWSAMITEFSDWPMPLINVFVRSECRGRGLGKQLVRALIPTHFSLPEAQRAVVPHAFHRDDTLRYSTATVPYAYLSTDVWPLLSKSLRRDHIFQTIPGDIHALYDPVEDAVTQHHITHLQRLLQQHPVINRDIFPFHINSRIAQRIPATHWTDLGDDFELRLS